MDPGHDNTHAGAHQSGLKEEELNLKIAKYCKAELEQYAGVTVYLSRPEDGSCPHPGTSSTDCNAGRVAYAKSVGANVYVSLHLNSNGNQVRMVRKFIIPIIIITVVLELLVDS